MDRLNHVIFQEIDMLEMRLYRWMGMTLATWNKRKISIREKHDLWSFDWLGILCIPCRYTKLIFIFILPKPIEVLVLKVRLELYSLWTIQAFLLQVCLCEDKSKAFLSPNVAFLGNTEETIIVWWSFSL